MKIQEFMIPLLIYFTKPFEADQEYIERRAWKSIEKYFEKTSYLEGWGGFSEKK